MIRPVEQDKATIEKVIKPKIKVRKIKKRRRLVQNDYRNEENPLLFAGFLLLLIAAFIFVALLQITDRSSNSSYNNIESDTEIKTEIINSNNSESKDTENNTSKLETQS